jgi:hypothetical protein
MTKTGNLLRTQARGPFDSAARNRIERMRLIDDDNHINTVVMNVFSDIFVGTFYDDLQDHYSDTRELRAIYETFKALYRQKDYRHMYLFMSIQYDYMRQPLPDPVWWLAGDNELIHAFMRMLIERFEIYLINSGHRIPEKGCITS